MPSFEAEGWKVEEVWNSAQQAFNILRTGQGPAYLHTRCIHLEGHFLGDPLLRMIRKPLTELTRTTGNLIKSAVRKEGASLYGRTESVGKMLGLIARTFKDRTARKQDPLPATRALLEEETGKLKSLEGEVATEIQQVLQEGI